ncbi:MAG: hypothetical protein K8S16_04235 [Bacteroidales bacterium]|nr:hypothetical protein [Bacteroidales bacterium]
MIGNYRSKNGNQIEIWKGDNGHLVSIIKGNETTRPLNIKDISKDKKYLILAGFEIRIINNEEIELKDKGISELFSKI